MVPQFNGGAYNPAIANNGNPNTVYNTAPGDGQEVPYLPNIVQPLGGGEILQPNYGMTQPEQAIKPTVTVPQMGSVAAPKPPYAESSVLAPKPRYPEGAPVVPNIKPRLPVPGQFGQSYVAPQRGMVSYGNVTMPQVTDTNADRRSPMAITLPTIAAPDGRLQGTTFGSGADYWRTRLASLSSTLPTFPLPGTNPTQPVEGGGTAPAQPIDPALRPPSETGRPAPTLVPAPGSTSNPGRSPWPDSPAYNQTPQYGNPVRSPTAPLFNNSNPLQRNNNSAGWTSQLGDMFRNGLSTVLDSLRSEATGGGAVNDNATSGWRAIGTVADTLLPGGSQLVEWLRQRQVWGPDGKPEIALQEIARMDPESATRELMRQAMDELGNVAITALEQARAGQQVSDSDRRAVDTLRAQLQAAGFPTNIEDMSRGDMANLMNRINTANQIYDRGSRVVPAGVARSVGTGWTGPTTMNRRLRNHTMAGRSGTMDAANRLEEEAVIRFQRWVDSQAR